MPLTWTACPAGGMTLPTKRLGRPVLTEHAKIWLSMPVRPHSPQLRLFPAADAMPAARARSVQVITRIFFIVASRDEKLERGTKASSHFADACSLRPSPPFLDASSTMPRGAAGTCLRTLG